MANKTVYPEWVLAQKKKGQTVKKVGNNYYLYKHSSKRVPGKKNPVPNDTFIGVITPGGIEYGTKTKVDTRSITVREYGFSYALLKICPESWKAIQGKAHEEKLRTIIKSRSKNTYLNDDSKPIKSPAELRVQLGGLSSSLQRHLVDAYDVKLDDLQVLDTIYLVQMDEKSFISNISDAQQQILEKIQLKLEVP